MDSEDQRSDDSSVEGAAMEPESDNSDEELLLNILPKRRKISVRYGSSSSSSEEKALVDADRISALPDSLLHHILSFLQTKHAAKTSLLSKRWHPLWTFNSVLKFRDPDYYHDCPYGTGLSQFVTCIHRTLILHQSPKIEKLLVQFDYRKRFSSDVDVWVRFAARKNVEELGLNFYSDRLGDEDVYDDDSVPYVLPLSLFSVSSLVTLKLSRCEFGPHRGVISWKALKVLSLSEMSLSNDSIRDVLSGSPSLELLEFHDCWGFDFVYIKSVRLRKVVIDKYGRDWNPDSVSSLKILAAKVRSLEITGYLKTHKICVITSCYLVEAKLDFHMPSDSPGSYCIQEEYPKILKELFPNLNHVEDLTVGSRFLKVLSVVEEKAIPCPLSNGVYLLIETQLSKWELPGIARLLELTPVLKTLVIKMTSGIYQIACGSEFLEFYLSSQMTLTATLLNFTTVKIVDFMATEREIELILFLLKNARLLEKMIICTRKPEHRYVSMKQSLKVAQRLLSSPRCCPNAVVLFS